MQFTNDTFQVTLVNKSIPIFVTLGIISDTAGALQCYSNGVHIYNADHKIMQNGDNFQSPAQFPYGYPLTQSLIILPVPDTQGIYIMIDGVHKDIGTDVIIEQIRHSIIDMSFNNGLGKIIQKKITVENSSDTLNVGLLTAVRHGNGRDWWLLTTKYESNIHRKYLISPEGIHFHEDQAVGDTVHNGVGYAAFSPSGQWYARYFVYGKTSDPKTASYIYQFDRCTGLLSTPLHKMYNPPEYYGGVAFSPNSRYLYVANYTKIFQYDLEASDILASEQVVAEYDGFLDGNGVPTRFFGLLLAPDNKIYGNIPGFNSRYLHVIDQPDQPGAACNVIQHAIYLPRDNFGTLPNVPFYRLYAAGIPCDSIVGAFTPPPAATGARINVWPVPAADVLYFSAGENLEGACGLQLFDALGRPALRREDIYLKPSATVRLDGLTPGAYVYRLTEKSSGRVIKAGRVVKTE
ncbi:MAG: hypothetical protein IPK76_25395 [Lewinellaceae bacterium]|nr:hypothetical protein [Lewinellaceae bacterium]